ncbi:MAG: pantoate--beta-alanine ligase [Vicinamibacterales bacterium]
MIVARTITEVRAAIAARAPGATVGFVPTMGALHAGHVALIAAARRETGFVVASVFVNPTQFNDPSDLAAYPRTEDADRALAGAAGTDVFFAPAAEEIYPAGHATVVQVGGPSEGFEGAHRPGHFAGVATVCLKLFAIVRPDVVYLGQKDAQQVAVLRRLVTDVDLDLRLRVVPTVREADGLALSSRNVRLSPDARAAAAAIPRALAAATEAHRAGADPVAAARDALRGLDVEYADLATFGDEPTLVVAARVGGVRLIDNVPLRRPELAGL